MSGKGSEVPVSLPEVATPAEWSAFAQGLKRFRGKDMAPGDYDDLLRALVQELQEESTRLDACVSELEAMADRLTRRVSVDGRDHSE